MKNLGNTIETPEVTLAGTALSSKLLTYMVVVTHGSNASTARPSGAPLVYWKGSVSPSNGIPGDLWYDTTGD